MEFAFLLFSAIFFLFLCHELVCIITLILINIRERMKKNRLKSKQKII